MYFYDFKEITGEAVSYSTAAGQPVTGKCLQMSLLRFKAQGGTEEHSHAYEQIMYVVSGKLRVHAGEAVGEIGPGQAFLAPPNVKHQVTALEDTEVISCKNMI